MFRQICTHCITNNPIDPFCRRQKVESNIIMNFANFAKCSSCYDQTSEIKNQTNFWQRDNILPFPGMYPTVQLDTIALCYAAKQIFLYQHRKVHLLLTSGISLTISAVKKGKPT